MPLSDFLFGSQEKMSKLPTMSSDQEALFNQLLGGLGGSQGQGMQYLQQLLSGSPEAMQQFEAPYMTQFKQQTVPSLAERFSSLGSGAQRSSAFGQQMGAAGAGLSENLAALRGNMRNQALSQLMGFQQQALSKDPFAYHFQQAQPGFLQAMAPGIGAALGMGMTGGMSGMGSGISSLMNLMTRSGGSGMRPGEMYNPQYGYRQA